MSSLPFLLITGNSLHTKRSHHDVIDTLVEEGVLFLQRCCTNDNRDSIEPALNLPLPIVQFILVF